MTSKAVWFITGVSSGFGLALAKAAAESGKQVVGTLRKQADADTFMRDVPGAVALRMDVTIAAEREAAVAETLKQFGRIDVLVNNAGYGLFGAIEEISEAEARAQMETNFFGALFLTQLALPAMRAQGSGHIVQISSIAGLVGSSGLGLYNASKFALEGFSEALAAEAGTLGVKVTLVEPGPYRTRWAGDSAVRSAKQIGAYGATAHLAYQTIHGYSGQQPGDPDKGARLIVAAVDGGNAPLHLPLGDMAIDRLRVKLQRLAEEVDAWDARSRDTAFTA